MLGSNTYDEYIGQPSPFKSTTCLCTVTLKAVWLTAFPLESVAVTVIWDVPERFFADVTSRLLPLTVALTRPGLELTAEKVTTEGVLGAVGKMGTVLMLLIVTRSERWIMLSAGRFWRTGKLLNGGPNLLHLTVVLVLMA